MPKLIYMTTIANITYPRDKDRMYGLNQLPMSRIKKYKWAAANRTKGFVIWKIDFSSRLEIDFLLPDIFPFTPNKLLSILLSSKGFYGIENS